MGNQAPQPSWINPTGGLMIADKGTRVVGYLIDILPAIPLGLFGIIPIIGQIIAGLFLASYWLLRDITGNSLGKMLLKTHVVLRNGEESGTGARVLRNLPLMIAPVLFMIPFIGYILGSSVSIIVILVESIMLLTQGERLGDKLAGTIVVKKAA
jgi:uncharacterized RDD family membrane protein YckC